MGCANNNHYISLGNNGALYYGLSIDAPKQLQLD